MLMFVNVNFSVLFTNFGHLDLVKWVFLYIYGKETENGEEEGEEEEEEEEEWITDFFVLTSFISGY